jgi:hypothetical protein
LTDQQCRILNNNSLLNYKSVSIEQRLELVKISLVIFFAAGILISHDLWLSNRFFPLAPVFESFIIFNFFYDIILFAGLLIGLLCIVPFKKKLPIYLVLCILIFLFTQDQMRWQPWVYIYLLMLFCFAFGNKNSPSEFFNSLQIIFVGIYIWSGLHKLNPNFIEGTFSAILVKLFHIKVQATINFLLPLGYSIPLIEIFIGVALYTRRLRNWGVLVAIVTHVFILIYLSPLGINYNYIVYPWNLAMIVFVPSLFYNVSCSINFWECKTVKAQILPWTVIIFVWLAPILNTIGYWDSYLSFALYSDKLTSYYIAVEQGELGKIDKRLSKYFVNVKGLSGGQIIDMNKWSLAELNVPFNPEKRIFKKVAKSFCKLQINNERLVFLECRLPLVKQNIQSFTCADIDKDLN